MDLCFIIDSSASICNVEMRCDDDTVKTCDSWKATISLMHKFVENLDIGVNGTRVAVVVFGSDGELRWDLTRYV